MIEASTHQYPLQDMVSDINELMSEYRDAGEEAKRALLHVAGIVQNKFLSFELKEPKLTGPLADPENWYVGDAK